MNALLEARQSARRACPGGVLVDEFDCAVRGGEFVALLGGNGTGKSLLLRTLAGLRPPDGGSVRLRAPDIAALPRRSIATQLGFLPQDPDAPPQGTLFDSVLLGRFAHLGFWETNGPHDEQRTLQALADVGLGSPAARASSPRSPAANSGARPSRACWCRRPSIYLLDEPTNHLDPAQQLGILERLRALARAGAAVVASLHDPNLALRFADRIWLLSGSGRRHGRRRRRSRAAAHLARSTESTTPRRALGKQRFMAPV